MKERDVSHLLRTTADSLLSRVVCTAPPLVPLPAKSRPTPGPIGAQQGHRNGPNITTERSRKG